MATIKKLILKNFKRFEMLDIEFDSELNILVGGNEAGKSSILQALDIVMSVSRSKIESIGIETIFNKKCIAEFLSSDRKISNLPEMLVEVYFEGINDRHDLDGRNNSMGIDQIGIKMICRPSDEYTIEIQSILNEEHDSFPFEYYGIHFLTFTDEPISPYRKPFNHLLIDNSQINNEYATREYTRSIFMSQTTPAQRNLYGYEYRKAKSKFRDDIFRAINDSLESYKFDIRTNSKASVETDIVITEDGIPIDSRGKGRQCFIKTEFVILNCSKSLNALLIEEPENHLSHVLMRQLIERIKESTKKQLFIATHSSLIATRLNLKKVLMLNEDAPSKPVPLRSLSNETANFFMKAPDNNLLELALCKKAILVEGDAEFILIDLLYGNSFDDTSINSDGIHVISVDGTSFKRYLELANLLKIKVAVIRDNDGDYQENCVANYSEYDSNNIKVFADSDNKRYTFEICVYEDNKEICDDIFGEGRRSLSVVDYMLNNKTEAIFRLLQERGSEVLTPSYIHQAFMWIRA